MDKPNNTIIISFIAAAVLLVIVLIAFAIGSRDDMSLDNKEPKDPEPTTSLSVQTVTKAPIYDITLDKVEESMESISKLHEVFDIQSSTYRSLQRVEGGYSYLNTSDILCTPKAEVTGIDPEVRLNGYLEYRGESLYPSSINFGYKYITEEEDKLMSSWVYTLISKLLNDSLSNSMQAIPNGNTKDSVYKVDNLVFSVSKSNEPLEGDMKIASYAIMVTESTDGTLVDHSLIELDKFNPSDNPNYGLFNTPIFSYSETLSLLEDRLGRIWGLNDKAAISLISDRITNTTSGSNIDTMTSWLLTDENSNQIEASIVSNEIYTLETNNSDINLTYSLATLPNSDKKLVFYSMEDILEGMLSAKVELQDYYDSEVFTITLDKPDNVEPIGYPLELSFKSEQLIVDGETQYKLSVVATTKQEVTE